jgi:hypothetical protein
MMREGESAPHPPTKGKEVPLTDNPAIRRVLEINPHFSSGYEFGAQARADTVSQEVSEDAFVRGVSSLAEREGDLDGERWKVVNQILALDSILRRESIQTSPHRDAFEEALHEIAERFSFDLEDKDKKEG